MAHTMPSTWRGDRGESGHVSRVSVPVYSYWELLPFPLQYAGSRWRQCWPGMELREEQSPSGLKHQPCHPRATHLPWLEGGFCRKDVHHVGSHADAVGAWGSQALDGHEDDVYLVGGLEVVHEHLWDEEEGRFVT